MCELSFVKVSLMCMCTRKCVLFWLTDVSVSEKAHVCVCVWSVYVHSHVCVWVCVSICCVYACCMHACADVRMSLSARMRVYMHVCMHACAHMFACPRVLKSMCMFVRMYVHMYVCMYACMHACMCVCMYICMYACISVCMYVCMHVCMHACMYISMHLHHRQKRSNHSKFPEPSLTPAATSKFDWLNDPAHKTILGDTIIHPISMNRVHSFTHNWPAPLLYRVLGDYDSSHSSESSGFSHNWRCPLLYTVWLNVVLQRWVAQCPRCAFLGFRV